MTNLLVNPGTRVPATSVFTHSKKPTTKDLAGNSIETGRQKAFSSTSYYEQLEAMSPAAPAAPLETRSYASVHSSAASRANTSECQTPAKTVYSTPPSEMAIQINNASAAAHVRAAAHRMEHEQLCRELASAIAAEDFRRANELKAKRDELRSRGTDSEMSSSASSVSLPAPTPRTEGSMTPAKSTASYANARLPSGNGGLGFLLTVFSHNPEHTPTPDAYFHA